MDHCSSAREVILYEAIRDIAKSLARKGLGQYRYMVAEA
jgi:hypothetical protein